MQKSKTTQPCRKPFHLSNIITYYLRLQLLLMNPNVAIANKLAGVLYRTAFRTVALPTELSTPEDAEWGSNPWPQFEVTLYSLPAMYLSVSRFLFKNVRAKCAIRTPSLVWKTNALPVKLHLAKITDTAQSLTKQLGCTHSVFER